MITKDFLPVENNSAPQSNRFSQLAANGAAVLVLLFFGYSVLSSILTQLSNTFSELKKEQDKEVVLEQKYASLNKLDTTLLERSNQVLIVLPGENAASNFIGHTRRIIDEENLELADISIQGSSEEIKGIRQSTIEFSTDVDDIDQVKNLLSKIKESAPINTLDELEIEKTQDGGYSLKFTYASYWSILPSTIPAISEPLITLLPEDNQLLESLVNFKPLIITQPNINASDGRPNPFE